MSLGVVNESQVTNQRQSGLSVITLPTVHSCWLPGGHVCHLATKNTLKRHQIEVSAHTLHIVIKKSLKICFSIKSFNKI
jgi:hypothetical protein